MSLSSHVIVGLFSSSSMMFSEMNVEKSQTISSSTTHPSIFASIAMLPSVEYSM